MQPRDKLHILLILLALTPTAWRAVADNARAQGTPAPYQASSYAELFEEALDDIDRYWRTQFEVSGLPYRTPGVRWLESVEIDACGPFDPQSGPGA